MTRRKRDGSATVPRQNSNPSTTVRASSDPGPACASSQSVDSCSACSCFCSACAVPSMSCFAMWAACWPAVNFMRRFIAADVPGRPLPFHPFLPHNCPGSTFVLPLLRITVSSRLTCSAFSVLYTTTSSQYILLLAVQALYFLSTKPFLRHKQLPNLSHNEVLCSTIRRGQPRCRSGRHEGHAPCGRTRCRPSHTHRKPHLSIKHEASLIISTGRRWWPHACSDRNGTRPSLHSRVHHRQGRRHGHVSILAEEPHRHSIYLRRTVPKDGGWHGLWLHGQPRRQPRRHLEHDR